MQQFELMRALIQKTAPEESFSFLYNTIPNETENYGMCMVVQNSSKNFTFSVLETSVWTDVKRILLKKLDNRNEHEWICAICCEASSVRVNCNKCSNDTCGECYIRTFVTGQGVIICPFCRHRTGQQFPAHMIPTLVEDIRSRFPSE